MKTIKLDISNFSSEDVEKISFEIKKGETVVLPTDTIYGLSALANSNKSVEKICDIKNRDRKKNLVVVMKSFCMVRKYCYLNQKQYDFIKKSFERSRPTTVILKGRDSLKRYLMDKEGGVAVRIPMKSDLLIKVLKNVDEPLISTSLNMAGQKELMSVHNIDKYFTSAVRPDLVVDAGEIRGRSSRIVDIRDMDDIKVLRK